MNIAGSEEKLSRHDCTQPLLLPLRFLHERPASAEKVAALYFDKLVLLDPVGPSWDTIRADHVARDAVRQLKNAGLLEIVTQATVLAKYKPDT